MPVFGLVVLYREVHKLIISTDYINEPIKTFLLDRYFTAKLEVDKLEKRSAKYTSDTLDPTTAVFPNFDTYEGMLQDDTQMSHSRRFPKYSWCPYLGLRKPFTSEISKNSTLPKCRPRLITTSDCKDVVKHYGKYGIMKTRQCNHKNSIKICTVSKLDKKYKREDIQISCDASACPGKQISLGLFNETVGEVTWSSVKYTSDLSKILRNHITSSVFAPGFALLKCKDGRGTQVLSFPKILDRRKTEQSQDNTRRFNINIVVEDSLSRAHFYRTLTKTVSTLRNIIYNQSIPATLLDFEKVQSYASNTYRNLQRLFTGRKYLDSQKDCQYGVNEFLRNNTKNTSCTYGVEEMFSRFQKVGYSTLLQEDHCWYDHWGSFLEPRTQLARVKKEVARLRRWKEFLTLVQKSGRNKVVDDYGISILSCDVYKKYKSTNPFSSKKVPNVCFAGRPYSSFILEHVKTYTQHNDMAAQPFIAYTHLLTSHDTNGKRIVNDDESLADLFLHAAHLRNTMTIFLSDHGAKVTNFAGYTNKGRQEVFQPLLFIIVPHSVGKKLGREVMNALVVNQNRLVGVEDLHHTFLSILDANQQIVGSYTDHNLKQLVQDAGLFKPIALDRTCEQMKLDSDVLCLCDGMDKTVSKDSFEVVWAAEFALGTLNNRIHQQYTKGLQSNQLAQAVASGFYGYGACQRYTGEGIIRARSSVDSMERKLFFSLGTRPLDRKKMEIFYFEVSFPLRRENGITLKKLIRVSPFNEYEECTDKGVEPQLCACHPDNQNNTLWRKKLYSKKASYESFELKPKTQILDHPCLVIISRAIKKNLGRKRMQNRIETYEAVNACPDVTYKLLISCQKARLTRVSLNYPTSMTLLPRTATFLMTVQNNWKHGIFIPRFTFRKSRLMKNNAT